MTTTADLAADLPGPSVVSTEAAEAAEAGTTLTEALPVVLDVGSVDAERIRAYVEGVLGWQAVDGDTARLVPPALTVADLAARGHGPPPHVLLVPDQADPLAAAEVALRLPADALLPWPAGRELLAETAAGLVASRRSGPRRTIVDLTIGGAAGGVGTTTVALAIAGIAAWSGSATLAVAAGEVPATIGARLDPDALAGTGVWERAHPQPGVANLRVVATTGPVGGVPVDSGAAQVVVRDVGVTDDADILVVRRDAAGLAALERTPAAAVVVIDEGPATPHACRAAAGERPCVELPRSVRVARAGLEGRVPGGLPGAWLRRLVTLAPRGPT